ncbi:choice-of-anchor I family protein [Nitratireductor sp. GCM10026969]|uniref:choice-of-anchor I family protein n=1 Tax=Nitratireductor sp. GCM10026969 TaxID=3252645 RepID=UPI00360D0894
MGYEGTYRGRGYVDFYKGDPYRSDAPSGYDRNEERGRDHARDDNHRNRGEDHRRSDDDGGWDHDNWRWGNDDDRHGRGRDRDGNDDHSGGNGRGDDDRHDWDEDDRGPGRGRDDDFTIELTALATYDSGLGEGAAEIVAHDPQTQRLFVVNAEQGTIDILDISDPKTPTKVGAIDVNTVNGQPTGGPNSVAVAGGIVAVAIEADQATDPGLVGFFDADGNFLGSVEVGSLPDMLVFTPDGDKLLVANEGEPDGDLDPKGSISVIDLSDGVAGATVATAGFTAFDAQQAALEAMGLRIFEGKVLSDDVEPEYIAISEDGKKAFVTLQEANAVAVVDIETATVTEIQPLGAKDHSRPGNGLDASDRDGDTIDIGTQPVKGLYMPDAISSYEAGGKTYYVTANEGDARDEEERIGDLELDTDAFPNAAILQQDGILGRLEVSTIDGDTDGDGDYDELYAYGARSFSIWDEDGNQVFDSGDMLEQITAQLTPELFNANDADPDEFDNRSDAKGPEPESVVIGEIEGHTYAFVGIERAGGGVFVFDITRPWDVEFTQYIRTEGDIAPEGLTFIAAEDSPNGVPMLAVSNEVSGTTTLYQINFSGEEIRGGRRDDELTGTAGNDEIDGRNGNDEIMGLAGNDELKGGNGRDEIFGGDGDDIILGGRGRDELYGEDGDDEIDGGNGRDELFGGNGDDVLEGGKGDDELFGGDGDDVLIGGKGNDEHDGGEGLDTVVFTGNRDDYLVDTDHNIVVDLRGGRPDGVDGIQNVEQLQFADQTVELQTTFTLELLHFTDQEAAVAAIEDAPNLSAVLNALRNQDLGNDGIADNTLTLSAGDAYIPGLFFDASEAVFGSGGIADIQIQNELGLQAVALGNHEFDFGTGVVAGLISGSAPGSILGEDFAGTAFPYLSANLDFSADPNLAPLEVEGGQAPQGNVVSSSTVIDVNGEQIGVVGATTPTLDVISDAGDLGILPGDFDTTPTPEQLDALAAVIQAEVDTLLADNPGLNKVVLLAHMQQISIELGLAERLENVDIIVAGGSNTRLFDDNDRPRDGDSDQGQYPQFVTNAGGTTTAVVNTDGSYKYVGRLVIDFDAEGNIIPESYDEDVSGAYATDDQGVADLGAEDLVDPEIQQIVDQIQEQIIATESNVFGVSDVFLNGNRSGVDDPNDPDGVRTQETNLGSLTADANLAVAQEQDADVVISIKNGGGVRASIGQTVVPPGGTGPERLPNEAVVDSDGNIVKPQGGISQNDIQTALAFNNGLTLLTLTKQELVDVLEHGVSALPEVAGQFPQVSGVKFSYDPDLPAGERIVNAGVFDQDGNLIAELVRDGEIVGDASQTFRIVTLNFLADGGDGYPFPTGPQANRVDLYDLDGDGTADGLQTGDATFADDGTEQDALAEYLDDNFGDAANAYAQEDTGRAEDTRIQNLDYRDDAVFDGAPGATQPAINEIRIDQDGTDNDEYFELFGEAGMSLAGYTYIVIGDGAGGSGVIEEAIDLSSFSLDADGFFVGAESTFSLGAANATLDLNFENSDNVTHLLVQNFTGAEGDDLDADDDGTLDTTPWDEVTDSVALVEDPAGGEQVYSAARVGPDGSFVPGHVYRSPDGTGDWQIGSFSPLGQDDTPGAANGAGSPVEPTDLTISQIQGAGHRSPYEGSFVRSSGIVTAIAANGFYMQDPEGDGDIATSDGIFVFGDTSGLNVGDGVTVEGDVTEFQFPPALSVTQISARSTSVESTGNDLPDTVVIGDDRIQPDNIIDDDGFASFDPTTDAIDFLESLEGMRVEIDDPLVVAGTNRFGEVGLRANATAAEYGSQSANAVVQEGDFNPEILLTDDTLITAPDATTGDIFATDAVGVLDYTFGAYKLQLTEAPIVVPGGRTPESTTLARDDTHATIATYNTLNLDPNDLDGDTDVAVGRFEAIAHQIVNNLGTPDILALQEIQDGSGQTDNGVTDATATLQLLIQAIEDAGGPTYAFASIDPVDNADGGAPGANIQNAFLYNPDRVTLDALSRIEDDAFEENGDGTPAEALYEGTRKPLVGTFTFNATGEQVTVVGNHLKSKSQDDGLYGENQPPEEITLPQRVDQAGVINDYVSDLLAGDPDANVVVLGDLNDFQFSDTLDTLKDGGDGSDELINLVDSLPTEDQYSFIFNGNSQALDHILVSNGIADRAPEVDIVHANLDYGFEDGTASDHDPILARIDLSDDVAIA